MRCVLALTFTVASTGCAADLARASSPAIGCAPEEIEVRDVSVGWAETSWSAQCRGSRFHCAGEDHPACSPDRDAIAPSPTTNDEPDDNGSVESGVASVASR